MDLHAGRANTGSLRFKIELKIAKPNKEQARSS
ncbi:MAG: hypothetical protein ACI8UO_000934 [Verrucomicrobiales bacterium]|jgi:hypothetical protein